MFFHLSKILFSPSPNTLFKNDSLPVFLPNNDESSIKAETIAPWFTAEFQAMAQA